MKNNTQTLIAVVFFFVFLYFWQSFVSSRYSTKPVTPPSPTSTSTATSSSSPTEPVSTNGSAPVNNTDTLTVLENDKVKVSLLSRGGRVASWQIKERDHWIELIEPEKNRIISPLETYPESNFFTRKESEQKVVFQTTLPSGVMMEKTVQLLAMPPFHTVTLAFSNPTSQKQTIETQLPWGNGIDNHLVGDAYDSKDEATVAAVTRAVALAGIVKSWKPGFIFHRTVDLIDNASFEWAGVDNNHFLAAFIADSSQITSVKAVADRVHPPFIAIPIHAALEPNTSISYSYKLYVGPKDYSQLKKLPYKLDQSVNFGFFGPIAKVLLTTLNFFKRVSGNYGWAIIMLTFCIQLLVFPLTRKNLQMSVKMRALQPQLKVIQEQFKKDPKRLQIETFNLYRKNGMKFMGMEGCFPMLLQLPIFFAFYSTLNVAYELRGAPWIFWIKDLGVHDPYYVLPILMALGMLAQQRFTAATMDPAQARMMMIMPLIFSFMFIHLPAGLVLYWCVNSLTTIVVQLFLGIHKQQSLQPAT